MSYLRSEATNVIFINMQKGFSTTIGVSNNTAVVYSDKCETRINHSDKQLVQN